jgi:predicted helicase
MKIMINNLSQYKNWQDLKSNMIDLISTKEKGDIFELITKYYLLIDPIYQTKLKKVWLLNEIPNDIKEYLNLPDNDEGIDLIANTKDDEFWGLMEKNSG